MNAREDASTTFLFTDIEGSSRLWEQDPERMGAALAAHNAIARETVERHGGTIVKMTGDGVYAAFTDSVQAVNATVQLQHALTAALSNGVVLRVRSGLHAGIAEHHDGDFFGTAVNRTARIMNAAHGGQVLVSKAVAARLDGHLPASLALRDLGQVRLRDLAEAEHVFQVVGPGLQRDFPPLRSLESTPNNLPHLTSSFIGRERELEETVRMLADSRLVTLIGAGGLGKSRLSLHAGAIVLDQFRDGVFFIELAALSDPSLVAQVIASTLGVKEAAGTSIIEALLEHVKDRALLLILDNCEHIVQACADIATRLLKAGKNIKVLATSREALRVSGEALFPVPPLPLPGPETPSHDILRFEGTRLFVERAKAALPSFAATSPVMASVADICRHLDGIPLAIELAAARVRTLSLPTIASQLRARFRLLTSGDRTALPRQQTLRACIDWSYNLLAEDERALFGKLAVFSGGWTLEGAEAVAGRDDGDVVDILIRLVEKSLVIADPAADRYTMLETIAEYACDKLRASGGEEVTRERHFQYCLALAERAQPELFGPKQRQWLGLLDRELDNVLAAHGWCGTTGATADGTRLVLALRNYWFGAGLLTLGYRITLEALERIPADDASTFYCKLLHTAAMLAFLNGDYAAAARRARQSLVLARALGDVERISVSLAGLGLASIAQGEFDAARVCHEDSLALARTVDNPLHLTIALNGLAEFHRCHGDLAVAEALEREAIANAERHGQHDNLATELLNLSLTLLKQYRLEEIPGALMRAHAIVDQTGSKKTCQYLLDVLPSLCELVEDWSRAAQFFGAAERQRQSIGSRREPADEARLAPILNKARDMLGEAGFAELEAEGRSLSYADAMDEARTFIERLSLRDAKRTR